jgi:cytochrome c553
MNRRAMNFKDVRPQPILRLQYALCLAVAWLGLVSGQADAGAIEFPAASASEIAEQRCSICHGAKGQGSNPTFPKLAGQNFDYLVQQIRNFKSGVRRGTIMWAQLQNITDLEIPELARYFSNQRLTPSLLPGIALRKAGQEIYVGGLAARGIPPCASCHGPEARGNQHIPRLAGQHAEYIEAQLNRFIDDKRASGQTGTHPLVLLLTDEEIRAVSYFLSGLE